MIPKSDPAAASIPTHIDRYEVRGVFGSGAFATVYRAHDPTLDTAVALKVLSADHADDAEVRERFVREGRLLRRLAIDRLATDRLVVVHDIGEWNGQPYLVLESFASGSLEDRLSDQRDQPLVMPDAARRIIDEVEACLAALANGGVVHRDLKPSNLLIRSGRADGSGGPGNGSLLGPGESLVVADFGLARDASDTGFTVGGGTLGYLAPEQGRPSADVDVRADIYAATAIVAEVIAAGAQPASAALRQAIESGMAVDRDLRPATPDVWATEFRRALEGADSTSSSKRRALITIGVLVLAIVGALAFGALARDGSGSETEQVVDGPQIIGPDTLLIGEPGTYLHEDRVGVTYEWRMPDGTITTADSVVIVPEDPEDLTIELAEFDDGVERSSQLTIRVRTR